MAAKQNEIEFRVRSVPQKMHDEIVNVAKNLGTNTSSLIKQRLGEYLATLPEALKKPYQSK